MSSIVVSPAILGLIKCLPPGGRAGFSVWPKKEKDKFMTAFRAVIDLEYPEPDDRAEATSSGVRDE